MPNRELFLKTTVTAGYFGQLVQRHLDPVGIPAYLLALVTHVRDHQPVTPSGIAAASGVPLTTLRDNIRRLVDRGLARRIQNPDDARSYLLELDARGPRADEGGRPGTGGRLRRGRAATAATAGRVRASGRRAQRRTRRRARRQLSRLSRIRRVARPPSAATASGRHEQRQRPRQSDRVGDEADQRRADDEAGVADGERRGERRARRVVAAGGAEEQRHGVGDAEAAEREPDDGRHDVRRSRARRRARRPRAPCPPRSSSAAPSRVVSTSPPRRATAIPSEKNVKPIAAAAVLAPASSRR